MDNRIDIPTSAGPVSRHVEQSSGPESSILRCEHVSKHFGGVAALDDVSLSVKSHEVTALIGPNGAGKTTLFNCLAGAMSPDQGSVWFKGQRIDGRRPSTIARLGLVRTFQNLRMFAQLTAFESVLASASWRRATGVNHSNLLRLGSYSRRVALEALASVGLDAKANVLASRLALVEQRRLEIARALATGPSLLLLDEPAAGTTPRESEQLADLIRQLVTDHSMTVVVIEHTMSFVMRVAGIVHVLNFGHLIRSGAPQAIASDAEIREIYFGSAGVQA
jgi:branched-chain amino acid transport system ATP-binding protein